MRNLHKCLPWTRKNDVLQEEDPFRLRYDMVPVPTEKTYLANLPVLQSRPASRSVTTIGWKSTTTDTSKLGGCAASIFIFTASMGWHHTFWETFFFKNFYMLLYQAMYFFIKQLAAFIWPRFIDMRIVDYRDSWLRPNAKPFEGFDLSWQIY